jgi:YD repeat-containing protein
MTLRACALLVVALPTLAFAHAVVTPAESSVGVMQQYMLHVPNEKDVATVAVKLTFPPELDVTAVDEQPGWRLALEHDAKGRIVSATWTGSLAPKQKAALTFSARNPAAAGTVAWNVVQTYEDKLVVEWTGAAGSKTPASRTNIR